MCRQPMNLSSYQKIYFEEYIAEPTSVHKFQDYDLRQQSPDSCRIGN